jgi:integrase
MPHYHLEGVWAMSSNIGSVRYDKTSESWFVDMRWKGKRERIFRMPIQGGFLIPCKSKEMGDALKVIINTQIDMGVFHPDRFKQKKPMHLRAYVEPWFERQTHLMKATQRGYRIYLDKYIIPALGNKFITDITEADLEALVKSIPQGGKTKDNVLGCIMKLLHDAERSRDIDRAPNKPVMRGTDKNVDPEIVWLEPAEQEKILAQLAPKYRSIYMFGVLTGCRPSEARAVKWDDIKTSRGEIIFRHSFDIYENLVSVKGKKPLPVPITDELKTILDEIPKNLSEFVFINPDTGKPFTKALGKVFHNASVKSLGYSIGMAKATRTSFAQQLANGGMDIAMVSRWLRHSGTRVTKRYYEFQTSSMKSAVDKVRKIR